VIALLTLGVCWSGWSWRTGTYRRIAERILHDPIAAVDYQAYRDGPFVELRDQADIASIKKFIIEAHDGPERGEPGHELAIHEPDCAMRILFADGRVEELSIGDTLPFTTGRGRAVVLRANSVIAWRGFQRYGAGEIVGTLYGRLEEAGKLVTNSATPPGSTTAEKSRTGSSPLAVTDLLGAPNRDARALRIVSGSSREGGRASYGSFKRLRLLAGDAQWAANGHQLLHVCYDPGNTRALVSVVDVRTGATVRRIELAHPRALVGAAIAPDGDRVMLASYEIPSLATTVVVIDVASGKSVCEIPDYDGNETHASFSPDGARLALTWRPKGVDLRVGLYDATSGRKLWIQAFPQSATAIPSVVTFSHDGRWLMVGQVRSGGPTVIWDVATGAIQFIVAQPDSAGAVFAPREDLMAAVSTDLTLRVTELSQRAERCRLVSDVEHRIFALDYSPDGATLAVALADQTIRLLSAKTLELRAGWAWKGEPALEGVQGLTFSPDGTSLLIRTRDLAARILDLVAAKEVLLVTPPGPDERTERTDEKALALMTGSRSRPFSQDGNFLLLDYPEIPFRSQGFMLWGPMP
jgi:hypothetical protein